MSVTVHGEGLPLLLSEVGALWEAVRAERECPDTDIGLSVVSETEITRLNSEYHHQAKATNVLTFSYTADEHDIAVCMDVVAREALERSTPVREYAALVVTHALLHVTGLDHEVSEDAAVAMSHLEQAVLRRCGFAEDHL